MSYATKLDHVIYSDSSFLVFQPEVLSISGIWLHTWNWKCQMFKLIHMWLKTQEFWLLSYLADHLQKRMELPIHGWDDAKSLSLSNSQFQLLSCSVKNWEFDAALHVHYLNTDTSISNMACYINFFSSVHTIPFNKNGGERGNFSLLYSAFSIFHEQHNLKFLVFN